MATPKKDQFSRAGEALGGAIGGQARLAKAWAAFVAAFAAESGLELSDSTAGVLLSAPDDIGRAVVKAAVVAALVWLIPNRTKGESE